MTTEVRVPALPESVADATVLTWYKQPGDAVTKDENLVDLETDKVVLEVPAPADGVVKAHKVKEGDVVEADAVLALIEPGVAADAPARQPAATQTQAQPTPEPPQPAAAKPHAEPPPLAPAARRLIKELGLNAEAIPGTGRDGRVHKADVIAWLDQQEASAPEHDADAVPAERSYRPESGADLDASLPALTGDAGRPEQRVPMTRLRARIAERLVEAQQRSAMLTTFNEVDMTAVMTLRGQYKDLSLIHI
mgnify:CR=1 FL=1